MRLLIWKSRVRSLVRDHALVIPILSLRAQRFGLILKALILRMRRIHAVMRSTITVPATYFVCLMVSRVLVVLILFAVTSGVKQDPILSQNCQRCRLERFRAHSLLTSTTAATRTSMSRVVTGPTTTRQCLLAIRYRTRCCSKDVFTTSTMQVRTSRRLIITIAALLFRKHSRSAFRMM